MYKPAQKGRDRSNLEAGHEAGEVSSVIAHGITVEDLVDKRNSINTVRVVLSCMVVISHCYAIYFGSEALEPLSQLTNGEINSGRFGVCAFFVLSGLLVYRSWDSLHSVKRFLLHRARRIYPGYLVATLICGFVIAPAFAIGGWYWLGVNKLLSALAANLLFRNELPIDGVFTSAQVHAVNGALWSIPYEVYCYIAIIIAAVIFRKGIRLFEVIALIVVLTITKGYIDFIGWVPGGSLFTVIFGWPYLWLSAGSWFACGIALYLLRSRIRISGLYAAVLAVIFLSILSVIPAARERSLFFTVTYLPVTAYSVLYLCSIRLPRIEGFFRRHDISFGTYLYGFPIQQMIYSLFGQWLPFIPFVIFALTLSTLAGFVSWNCIEKPAVKFTRRYV